MLKRMPATPALNCCNVQNARANNFRDRAVKSTEVMTLQSLGSGTVSSEH